MPPSMEHSGGSIPYYCSGKDIVRFAFTPEKFLV